MAVVEAIATVFSPPIMLALLVGLILGIVLGSIPGIGGVIGMAILLPLTTELDGMLAIVLLTAIYLGSLYGGAVSAILLNIPGTSAAVASTFDGNPLAKEGKAMYALSISAISSSIGGFLSAVVLVLLIPFLVPVVKAVGTPQYFLIAVLGLVVLPFVSRGSQIKSLFAAALGLLITTIGISPVTSTVRFTFGVTELYNGIDYVAILLGLFAITEMINLVGLERDNIAQGNPGFDRDSVVSAAGFVLKNPGTVIKSSLIGLGIGSIPGAGASISNLVAYGEAVRSSDDSDSFGKGNEVGLIAAESSNNATAAGSLVPVLSFAIPGGAASAIILGAMILHGIVPGPQLFITDVTLVQSIFIAIGVGSLLILVIGLAGVTKLAKVTTLDKDLIIPFVVIFAICGSYTLNLNYVDILTVFAAGTIGYLFRKYTYPVVSLLLGTILGGIIETNFFRSMSLGGLGIFITDPLSIILLIGILMALAGPHLERLSSRIPGRSG